jgi:hypothetical protein
MRTVVESGVTPNNPWASSSSGVALNSSTWRPRARSALPPRTPARQDARATAAAAGFVDGQEIERRSRRRVLM